MSVFLFFYDIYREIMNINYNTNMAKRTVRLTESESTSIETLMATAASYMEDFDLGKYAEAVSCWENYTKSYILGCLKIAIQQAHKLMTQRVDDADDYLNVVYKAYTTFANMKEKTNESKSMNRKRTVRLTESELKSIITESVKNIISELDYKTGINAARKNKEMEDEYARQYLELKDAIKNGDVPREEGEKKLNVLFNKIRRTNKFSTYASKQFNDTYLPNTKRAGMQYDPKYDSIEMDYYDTANGRDGYYGLGTTAKGSHKMSVNTLTDRGYSKDDIADIMAANDEIADFERGNYDYTPGKSWSLKK